MDDFAAWMSREGVGGAKGDNGAPGNTGPQGEPGPTGERGPAGADGADGAPGADGAAGAAGATGPEGPAGPPGDPGADGADGQQGPQGETGPAGADGDDGAAGGQGIQGIPGPEGPAAWLAVAALANDVSTGANTTPVSVTGLTFNFAAKSTYVVEVFGAISAPAATTGCGLQWDVSVAVTQIAFQFHHQLASTGTLSGGHSIADDASVGVSSGIPANGGIYPVSAFGIIRTGANTGTAQLRLRSETTAVATIKAGTILRVHKAA